MNIEHKKTVEILKWFEEINKNPRCSKNEKQIGQWLMAWAENHDFEARQDKVGNVLIKVPASPGFEESAPVIIQGHQDMVCEKTPDSDHDFSKDPIGLVYDGEWLTADKTTLGADNGIAIAMGLAAALDKDLKHPPLELLFTVDEETAGTGAFGLEPGFVKGKRLINLDSEEEGILTIGSAGGEKSDHTLLLEYETVPPGYISLTIKAGGMAGGHSADIHHEKANALKVLGRVLYAVKETVDFRLANLEGGSADNAVPRNAEAVIYIAAENDQKARDAVSQLENVLHMEFKNTDPDLKLTVLNGSKEDYPEAVTAECTERVIQLILAVPHGIYAMSTEVEHFVETSNNFASFKIEYRQLKMVTMQRSPLESRLDDVGRHIASVVKLAGGSTKNRDRYPGWQANMKSLLLNQSVGVYEKLFGKKPVVETTHGGLECGVIGERLPGMDMISFGPTIKNPHSPDEKVHIGSISKVWDFLAALLEELK
ncbi:MAG: beta-Ala-His dipeptidase [Candidatus Aminicenantes bacterium]|nr:beta-Ala-His dipeptidase [Candidatus Aminicenantes bacterium]NIM82962.1 beta-Ala-His dipeptidase [Candidatus Aminicenantes bacterium]NIN22339.1 beta-Ala-His dipeptidase [Candidatus Aminicenantes bacterium]NIN46107.1 beta-Ala-His dipeptidase [Candidatus Aminicenantes bacterium]NIN88943.1 beta-Ala-His dipeptidase [Candidatus Aminicenantes bacterium]